MSALVVGGVVVSTISLTAAPAFSKSENASNGSERSDAKGDNRSDQGARARSRGAVNAFHANAMAFENASDNSHVGMGMIEVYKAAVMASAEADAALEWFRTNCEEPIEVDFVSDCTALLDAASVDPGDSDYYNRYIAILGAKIEELDELENEALELAANKETNDVVIEALWGLLDLEGFEPTEEVE